MDKINKLKSLEHKIFVHFLDYPNNLFNANELMKIFGFRTGIYSREEYYLIIKRLFVKGLINRRMIYHNNYYWLKNRVRANMVNKIKFLERKIYVYFLDNPNELYDTRELLKVFNNNLGTYTSVEYYIVMKKLFDEGFINRRMICHKYYYWLRRK